MRKWWYGLIVVLVAAVVYQLGLERRGGLQLSAKKIITGEGIKAPGFEGGGEWLRSDELKLDELIKQNKVVLVDFWTYSCINCQRTLPYLREWWEKYKEKGLVIVGVHSPEFEFEKNKDNVLAAMDKYEVTWPVVQDNEMRVWQAYANRYWPAKYLITPPNREIVYTHFGEGNYEETERVIRNELVKLGADVGEIELVDEGEGSYMAGQSPETYIGWQRGMFGDPSSVRPGEFVDYQIMGRLMSNQVYLVGQWKVLEEYAEAGDGAEMEYRFKAGEVNLVMGGSGKGEGFIDGEKTKEVEVSDHDLYKLYKGEPMEGELKLVFDRGVKAYAFTFGK